MPFGGGPWVGCSLRAFERRRARTRSLGRRRCRLAKEASMARLCISHHIFTHLIRACSCNTIRARSTRVRAECGVVSEWVRCLRSVLAVAGEKALDQERDVQHSQHTKSELTIPPDTECLDLPTLFWSKHILCDENVDVRLAVNGSKQDT